MYKKSQPTKNKLTGVTTYQGETIEQKVARITQQKQPISDGAPLLHTERAQGVLPGTNIRTDRFEHAVEAMDHVQKARVAKREAKVVDLEKKKTESNDTKSPGGEGENKV